MKAGARKTLSPLPGVLAEVDGPDRTIRLKVLSAEAGAGALKEFLYGALNEHERGYTVVISGVPFCFLPGAEDHILPACRARGRRVPACAACRRRPSCPGLPPGFSLPPGESEPLRPVLPAPAEVVFELNRRCNLACGVCVSRGLADELPPAEVKRQLRAARRLGVASARFTGGEPFLHPALPELLAYARKLGFHALLNTNATVPGPAAAGRAARHADNILVSLQGFDARSEAEATGVPGLFAKKLANARLFRRKVGTLRLGTVLSGRVLKDFSKYLALARSLKADVWELYRPMPGAGKGDDAVTPRALRVLAGRLAGEPRDGLQICFANPLPICLFPRPQAPLFLGARFDDGNTRLVFDPRGFYKPSYYLQENLGADLAQAWASPLLKRLAALPHLKGICRRCELRMRCLGGSRFLAGLDGNLYGPDPWLPRLAAKARP